jgi:hypothetical protein
MRGGIKAKGDGIGTCKGSLRHEHETVATRSPKEKWVTALLP